jgi:integrase
MTAIFLTWRLPRQHGGEKLNRAGGGGHFSAMITPVQDSFGAQLLENGAGLPCIQSLTGHKSIKTAERYAYITTKGIDQIQNPFDKLDIKIYYYRFVKNNGYVLSKQISVFC